MKNNIFKVAFSLRLSDSFSCCTAKILLTQLNGLPPVEVDKVEIQQVAVNLVRNAIEALQSVRTRTLTLRVFAGPDDHQEILVADTGTGVGGEMAATLFQPFVTSKTGGMGLGLLISQSIIEAHGGRIWYEPNPGGGSVFRCSLPSLAAG